MTTALEGGEGSASCSGHSLPPGKGPVPIVQEAGWPPRPVWTRVENLDPPPGFDARTVQPLASRYTDWCIRLTGFHLKTENSLAWFRKQNWLTKGWVSLKIRSLTNSAMQQKSSRNYCDICKTKLKELIVFISPHTVQYFALSVKSPDVNERWWDKEKKGPTFRKLTPFCCEGKPGQ